MLSQEDNELLVRVGPGTAMGQVFRSYWSPIADAKQLADKEKEAAPEKEEDLKKKTAMLDDFIY